MVSQLNHTDSHAKIQSNEVLELANMKQQRGVQNDIIRRINEAIQNNYGRFDDLHKFS